MSDLKPLILHAHATGPNPIKIAAALEYLSVPHTIKMWDLSDDAKTGVKGKTFLSINENGRVQPWVKEYDYAGLLLEDYPLTNGWLKNMGGLQQIKDAYRKIEDASKTCE